MHRINLSVDIDDNKLLEESTRNAITNEVKQLTREAFKEVLDEEFQRLLRKEVSKWTDGTGWYTNKGSAMIAFSVRKIIDEEIKAEIDKYPLSQLVNEEIKGRIQDYVKVLESECSRKVVDSINASINARVDRMLSDFAVREFMKNTLELQDLAD